MIWIIAHENFTCCFYDSWSICKTFQLITEKNDVCILPLSHVLQNIFLLSLREWTWCHLWQSSLSLSLSLPHLFWFLVFLYWFNILLFFHFLCFQIFILVPFLLFFTNCLIREFVFFCASQGMNWNITEVDDKSWWNWVEQKTIEILNCISDETNVTKISSLTGCTHNYGWK